MVITNMVITNIYGEPMYYLGIDGGGTKTAFALYDEKGTLRAATEAGSASHWQFGADHLASVLKAGLEDVLSSAGIKKSDLSAVGFGMSGLGEDLEKDLRSIEVTKGVFGDIPVVICNDVESASVGSLAGKPGIHVVVGTGSIAFGRNENGQTERCGGWGHDFGDEGSGYWLGKQAVNIFSKQSDGRLEKSHLYELMKETLGIKTDFEAMTVFQDKYANDRTKTAALQRTLLEAASLGDASAIAAYKNAVQEMVELPQAIAHKLGFEGTISVSYSGGLFNAKSLILEPFKRQLENMGYEVVPPIFSPLEGAAIMAAEALGADEKIKQGMLKNR